MGSRERYEDYKDFSGSLILYPWESPRTPYLMPDHDECPHCGHTAGGNIFLPGKYFRCYKCCTIVSVAPAPVLPFGESMLAEDNNDIFLTVTCPECGKVHRKKETKTTDECLKCHAREVARAWRTANLEKKRYRRDETTS